MENPTTNPDNVESKAQKMQQADGKDHKAAEEKELRLKKTYDVVWARNHSKFKTLDPEEYLARLRAMTKLDLMHEMPKFGYVPRNDRESMIQTLYKECRRHIAALKTCSLKPVPISVNARARAIHQRAAMVTVA